MSIASARSGPQISKGDMGDKKGNDDLISGGHPRMDPITGQELSRRINLRGTTAST